MTYNLGPRTPLFAAVRTVDDHAVLHDAFVNIFSSTGLRPENSPDLSPPLVDFSPVPIRARHEPVAQVRMNDDAPNKVPVQSTARREHSFLCHIVKYTL